MAAAEVEQFRKLWAEKSAAKETALAAYQQARLDEQKGRDSAPALATGDESGISGVEGAKFREAEQLCIDTVIQHPEYFVFFEGKTQEQIVALVDVLRASGLEDDVTLATMYELGKWERQNIGGVAQARIRLPGRNV